MTTHRIRGRARVEANARLTAMTGIVLLLVFLTMLVFVRGIGLIVGRRQPHGSFLIVHKASFYLWLVTLVIHVAAHSKNVVHLAGKNLARRTRIRMRGAGYSLLTFARRCDRCTWWAAF